MKSILSKVLVTCGSTLSILGAATSSAEAASFFLDFESPLPSSAVSLSVTPSGVIPFVPSIETLDGNRFLRLSDDLPAALGGASTSVFADPTQVFEDVTVSALLNPAGDSNDQVTVFARVDLNALNAYTASIDFAENRLIVSKAIGGSATVLADAFDVLPDVTQPYFVELEVVGHQLTGRFFDATGTHQLLELTAVDLDNPLLAGVTAIGADISETAFPDFSDPNSATFDNFGARSISVPEPTHVLSLVAAGALAMGASLHRKVNHHA